MIEIQRLRETKEALERFLAETNRRLEENLITRDEYELLLYDRLNGHDPRLLLSRIDAKINEEKNPKSTFKNLVDDTPTVVLASVLIIGLILGAVFLRVATPTGFSTLDFTGEEIFNKNITDNSTFIFNQADLIRVRTNAVIDGTAKIILVITEGNSTRELLIHDGPGSVIDACKDSCLLDRVTSIRVRVEVHEGWVFLEKLSYEKQGLTETIHIPDLVIYGEYELDLSKYYENALGYSLDTVIPLVQEDSIITLLPNATGEYSATAYAIGIDETITQEFTIRVEQAVPVEKRITPDKVALTTQEFTQTPGSIGTPIEWKTSVIVNNQPLLVPVLIHEKAQNIIVRRLDTNQIINDKVIINETNISLATHNLADELNEIDIEIREIVSLMSDVSKEDARLYSKQIQELERKKKDLEKGKITGLVTNFGTGEGLLSRFFSWIISKITGRVTGVQDLSLSLPKESFSPDEEITFGVTPAGSEVSLYVYGPGHKGYLATNNFTTNITGNYSAVALITNENQFSRIELDFKVEHNASSNKSISSTINTEANITETPVNDTIEEALPEQKPLPSLGAKPLVLLIPYANAYEITYETTAPELVSAYTPQGLELLVRSPYPYNNILLSAPFPDNSRVKRTSGAVITNIEVIIEGNNQIARWTDNIIPGTKYLINTDRLEAPLLQDPKENWKVELNTNVKGKLELRTFPEKISITSLDCGEESYELGNYNASIENFSCSTPIIVRGRLNGEKSGKLSYRIKDLNANTYFGDVEQARQTSIESSIALLQDNGLSSAGDVYLLIEANKLLERQELKQLILDNEYLFEGPYAPFKILLDNQPFDDSKLNSRAKNLKWNDNYIPILLCQHKKMPVSVFNRLERLEDDDSHLGEYNTLHALIGLLWIKERGCYDKEKLDQAIAKKVVTIQNTPPITQDILLEQSVFLAKAGVPITEEQYLKILNMQSLEGGFGLEDNPAGSPHTTALAVWALTGVTS